MMAGSLRQLRLPLGRVGARLRKEAYPFVFERSRMREGFAGGVFCSDRCFFLTAMVWW